MKYRITADSTSNLFQVSDVDFTYVPMKVITELKEYVDTPDLDVPEMVDEIKKTKGKSGTSCPNVHDWTEAYGDAEVVFAVTITGNLSGSYSAAMQAAEDYKEEHPGANVEVVDSLSAGPEMQLLVEKLKEDVLAEKSFEEIRDNIHAYHKHTHLLFSLQSLTNLARNGRVNPAVAAAAGVLGIRIVGKASDEGTLEPMHKCRGEKKALEAIYAEMKKHGYQGGKLRIAHCQNEKSAEILKTMTQADFPQADIQILECTGLCSFYAEKGGLMIGFDDLK